MVRLCKTLFVWKKNHTARQKNSIFKFEKKKKKKQPKTRGKENVKYQFFCKKSQGKAKGKNSILLGTHPWSLKC